MARKTVTNYIIMSDYTLQTELIGLMYFPVFIISQSGGEQSQKDQVLVEGLGTHAAPP